MGIWQGYNFSPSIKMSIPDIDLFGERIRGFIFILWSILLPVSKPIQVYSIPYGSGALNSVGVTFNAYNFNTNPNGGIDNMD